MSIKIDTASKKIDGTVSKDTKPSTARNVTESHNYVTNSHVGGLERALATSTILTITVLIPLPLPST